MTNVSMSNIFAPARVFLGYERRDRIRAPPSARTLGISHTPKIKKILHLWRDYGVVGGGGSGTTSAGGIGVWSYGGSSASNSGGTGVLAVGGISSTSGKSVGIAIQAIAGLGGNGAAQGLAGYFEGNVEVVGFLSKAGGSFKIDHPFDPENKYLSHSFVESIQASR